jgi:outer membrane receptor protein involved in Fe transport
LLVLFCASAGSAHAQVEATIRGQVVAPDGSGVAVPVTLRPGGDGAPLQVTADAAGRFVFVGVRPGEYVLSVTADGFSSRETRIVVAPREIRTVILTLAVGRITEAVDVRADRRQPGTHSPSSTLLSAERIDELPLAQRTSLPDAIVTAAPGMIRGHDDFVHIRGHEVALNPSINGVQFWENAHAVFSPGVGVDYVDSIHVMTGGFSAEYGNRFGGILDVVTKSGFAMRNRGSVWLGAGTEQRHNAGVEFGTARNRFAYYLNVGGFTSDRFLSPPSPRSIHNSGHGVRTFARLDVRGSDRSRVDFVFAGDGVDIELPMDERDETLRPDFKNEQRARTESVIASWNHVPASDVVIQASAYQRWSSLHQRPGTIDRFGAQTDAQRSLQTYGLKAAVTGVAGKHAVKAGVEAVVLRPREELYYLSQPWIDFTHLPQVNESHVHFRGPNPGAGAPRPVTFSGRETGGQVSVFGQDQIQLTSRLTLDVGARVDRYSLTVTASHVSPRVNAAYRFGAGTVLFGSYNHFFVPPPIENVLAGSAGLTQLVSEVGRPLPPVRAITEDQFEAGVTHPISGSGTVGITGYYRASDDPPHTALFPDSRFYTYASFDRGKAYGMELKATMPTIGIAGMSGYLNYALGRVWLYNPITAGFTTEAAHLTESGRFLAPMDQTHTVTSGLSYHHQQSRMWAAVSVEYGSGTPGGHGGDDHADESGEAHEHAGGAGLCATRCPSRLTPNLSVGWNSRSPGNPGRLSVQFNIENVSNRVYLLSKESSMVQGQYSIPRLISASVRMRF